VEKANVPSESTGPHATLAIASTGSRPWLNHVVLLGLTCRASSSSMSPYQDRNRILWQNATALMCTVGTFRPFPTHTPDWRDSSSRPRHSQRPRWYGNCKCWFVRRGSISCSWQVMAVALPGLRQQNHGWT